MWHIKEEFPRALEINLPHHQCRLIIRLIHSVMAVPHIEHVMVVVPVVMMMPAVVVPVVMIALMIMVGPVVTIGLVVTVGPVVMVEPVVTVEPVITVEPVVTVEPVITVGPVVTVMIVVSWEIPIPAPPPHEGPCVTPELIMAIVMPQVRPVVHALVMVGIIKAELPSQFLLVVVIMVANLLEFVNTCCGNLEMVKVEMTVLKFANPLNFPSKIPVHHVFKSEEVVPSSDVAVLPVAIVKVHEARLSEVHVEVVIPRSVEVHPVSSHFVEVEPVKVARCEVRKSLEVELVEVSVSEPASSKVVVVKVTISVTIEAAIVEVSIDPFNCTHLSPAESEVIKSAVIEFHRWVPCVISFTIVKPVIKVKAPVYIVTVYISIAAILVEVFPVINKVSMLDILACNPGTVVGIELGFKQFKPCPPVVHKVDIVGLATMPESVKPLNM